MFKIKRLYSFILQSFLPLFMMTFFICLFIVLMQFLWRYIDDLVGKGLEMSVIGELFFYAALTMVPMALPLAVLLASLMTFGNLGERFELMAMKASGISLIRVMKPLIILMIFIAIGAFFFQNNVLPVAQAKMYTLLWSMRQKSPELEIPEGVFYDQIPGYDIFVKSKNRDTGTLYDMMIYDVSVGNDLDRVRIILADSGRMSISDDKTHLFLRLYDGEQFENLNGQGTRRKNVPYRRESFSIKEILIPFDNNFNRMDESGMRNQYVGKNIAELRHTIDSVNHRIDSVGYNFGNDLINQPYFNVYPRHISQDKQTDIKNSTLKNNAVNTDANAEIETDTGDNLSFNAEEKLNNNKTALVPAQPIATDLLLDTLFASYDMSTTKSIATQAIHKAKRLKQDFEFRGYMMQDDYKTIRRHGIELIKKFTLSFACIIFFFIGAPLGAIIRKGGLGTPLVISVILFIIYYIIDNTGYKLARDGKWEVWEGMWLSSAVLLPLGVFLTYKAINDSSVLNADAYLNFFRRIFGITEVRHVEMKDITMDEVTIERSTTLLSQLDEKCNEYLAENKGNQNYIQFFTHGYDRNKLARLAEQLDKTIEYFSNSRDKLVINKLSDYPILKNLWFYNISPNRKIAIAAAVIFPIGLPIWLIGRKLRNDLHEELTKIIKLDQQVEQLINKETN